MMNDYSQYSSAPPSEVSNRAGGNGQPQTTVCQSAIDNVTAWLNKHEEENRASEMRANLFEAELTRRLSMLNAGSSRPASSQPAQLVRQPAQRPPSVASSTNKRTFESMQNQPPKQPRISDPTMATEFGHPVVSQATELSGGTGTGTGTGILTPPSSATTSMDAPPLPPRCEAAPPPLPPRPNSYRSDVELQVGGPPTPSSSNVNISFQMQRQYPQFQAAPSIASVTSASSLFSHDPRRHAFYNQQRQQQYPQNFVPSAPPSFHSGQSRQLAMHPQFSRNWHQPPPSSVRFKILIKKKGFNFPIH